MTIRASFKILYFLIKNHWFFWIKRIHFYIKKYRKAEGNFSRHWPRRILCAAIPNLALRSNMDCRLQPFSGFFLQNLYKNENQPAQWPTSLTAFCVLAGQTLLIDSRKRSLFFASSHSARSGAYGAYLGCLPKTWASLTEHFFMLFQLYSEVVKKE